MSSDADLCDQCVSPIDLSFRVVGMRLCLFCACWSTAELNDEGGFIGVSNLNPRWRDYAKISGVRTRVPGESYFFFDIDPQSETEFLIADAHASRWWGGS